MRRPLALLLCCLALAGTSRADLVEKTTDLNALAGLLSDGLKDAQIDIGVSVPLLSVEARDEKTNARRGELVGTYLPRPSIGISSTPSYLWGGLNYNFTLGYSWSSLYDQSVINASGKRESVDLDTGIDAYSVFVMPVLAYTFGTREMLHRRGFHVRVGLGVGWGWLLASGDILLTDVTPYEYRKVSFNKGIAASMAMLETRWNAYSLRFKIDGPTMRDGGLEYSFLKFDLRLAYMFRARDFEMPAGGLADIVTPIAGTAMDGWTGEAALFGGSRPMPLLSSRRYREGESNAITGLGGGVMLALKPSQWPLRVVVEAGSWEAAETLVETDFLHPRHLTQTASLGGRSTALNLGFRNHFREKGIFQPVFTGGITWGYSEIKGEIDHVGVHDGDFQFGFWVGGGLHWVFPPGWTMGADLRLMDMSSSLFGVKHRVAGGNYQLHLGWAF